MSTTPCAPFFKLPGEIRNLIYEYALRAPTILRYAGPHHYTPITDLNGRSVEHPTTIFELNQLKYVNKQLYRETALLELKFNSVHFTDPSTKDKGPLRDLILIRGRKIIKVKDGIGYRHRDRAPPDAFSRLHFSDD